MKSEATISYFNRAVHWNKKATALIKISLNGLKTIPFRVIMRRLPYTTDAGITARASACEKSVMQAWLWPQKSATRQFL
jgi:hypothetical protein